MTVSVHSELYCFSAFTVWWILRVFVHRKSVPCTLHFKEFCFVTNKLITLFLSPGFPCSRLNPLIIRQGLIILVVISKACIWNIFYFTHKTLTLGQGPATYYSTGIRQGLWMSVKFWQEQGSVTIDLFSLQPGSTYSTPGFNHFTQIQILFSHTDFVKCQSRQIIFSQTRFTLPTEILISLSFIIVAHNHHNTYNVETLEMVRQLTTEVNISPLFKQFTKNNAGLIHHMCEYCNWVKYHKYSFVCIFLLFRDLRIWCTCIINRDYGIE